MKRVYISGPMTGLPDFNYPAFNAEAARLRALGYHVENPAENPEQPCWEDYMKVAIRQMLTCDTIAVLPGWGKSRGAWMEVSIAERVGMKFCEAASIMAPASKPLHVQYIGRLARQVSS
ncbi:hypothetical protein MAJJADAN_00065 [Pseudomonas phage Amjad_SA]|nr:hypothetical protein MAJJADAN_00065 [Pseudomonas phage Amjad_SA]